MLRVLHIGKFYPPHRGGMERALQSLCASTRDRLDNHVIAFNANRSTVVHRVEGVPVTRVGTWVRAGSVPVSPVLVSTLRSARADVAVLHEPNPWALVAWAAARPALPLIVWLHSEVVRPRIQYRLFYQPIADRVYPQASRFIVSSPRLADHAAALAPYRARTSVVAFGVDSGAFDTAAAAERAAALRTEWPGTLVLFAGRLVPYKGLDVLIDAVETLPITLAVVGDGPLRGRLEARARASSGAARYLFTGAVDDGELRAWMHASDLLVLPSVTRAEAFGLVQLEAMACRKPVISTNLPTGVPWVNQHGVTGLVVPPDDADALREALATLAGAPALRESMGQAGAARVRQLFTLQEMSDRFVRICYEAARGGLD